MSCNPSTECSPDILMVSVETCMQMTQTYVLTRCPLWLRGHITLILWLQVALGWNFLLIFLGEFSACLPLPLACLHMLQLPSCLKPLTPTVSCNASLPPTALLWYHFWMHEHSMQSCAHKPLAVPESFQRHSQWTWWIWELHLGSPHQTGPGRC